MKQEDFIKRDLPRVNLYLDGITDDKKKQEWPRVYRINVMKESLNFQSWYNEIQSAAAEFVRSREIKFVSCRWDFDSEPPTLLILYEPLV